MSKSGSVASAPKIASSKAKSATRSLSSLVEEAFRTPGKPLDKASLAEMRARFGHDFTRVKIHRDVETAASLNAQAFTIGEDVFFAPGAYQPATWAGRDLLAHELVHTIQHGPVSRDGRWTLSHGRDPLEREADRASQWALGGRGLALPIAPATAAPGLISRKEAVTEIAPVAPEGAGQALDSRADAVAAQFRSDPDDKTGRVRRQLNRIEEKTRRDLLGRIRDRLTGAQWQKFQQVLRETLPSESEVDTVTAPAPDLSKELPPEVAVEAPGTAPKPPVAAEQSKSEVKPEKSPQEALEEDPGPEGAPKKAPVDAQHVEQEAKKKGQQPPAVATESKPPAATGGSGAAAPSSADAATAPAATEGTAQTGAAPGEAATAAVPGGDAGSAAGAEEAPGASAEGSTAEAEAAEPSGKEPAGAEPAGAEPAGAEPAGATAEVAAAPGGDAAAASTSEGEAQEAGPAGSAESTEPATTIAAGGPSPGESTETAEPPEVANIPDPASEEKEPEQTPAAVPELPPEPEPTASSPSPAMAAAVASPAPAATSTPAMMGGAAPAAEKSAGPKLAALGGGGAALPGPGAAPEEGPEEAGPEEMPPAVEAEVTGPEPAPPPPTSEGQAAPQPGGCEGGGGGAPGAEGEGGGGAAAGPCGGGGGGAAEKQTPEAAPDVSQADPAAAMGAVSNLPPAQLQSALGGVTSAASNAVKQQKEELKANPPSMDRPSGVPAQRDPALPVNPPALPAANDPAAVQRAAAGASIPVPQPDALPAPPAPPTQGLKGPQLPGEAPMTEADTARAKAAVENLPTTDPALNATAGDPPKLELAGDADPKQTREQSTNLDKSTTGAHQQGQQDVSAPMGENNVYPTVPPETLEAKPEGAGGPGVLGSLAACAKGGSKELAKAQGGAGAAADETVSIVAKEQKGDEIKAAASKAQGDMETKKEANAEKIADEKTKSQKEMDDAIQENAGAQKDERSEARKESIKVRGEWNKEQATLVGDAKVESGKTTTDSLKQVGDEQKSSAGEAAGHIADGNKKVVDARRDAETKAQDKKKDAKSESGGFLSWLSSKVAAFFDKIKSAIQTVFEAARKLVSAAIDAAKKLAVAAIEMARKFVVEVIKKAGDALIAIGDRVLAGFPKLRDKFRKAVKDRVDKAVDAVNKLADDLKKGVQKLLDLLGSAINGWLGLLECAYVAAVDAVAGVVKSAIDGAKAFVDALGIFGILIADISPNPGQWLSNLGRAVVDGIKNCLWTAFKSAIKKWFNDKLEEVLGLGVAIWSLLFKGCMKMKDITKMAWEGLISAIPIILIQLLVEKLVAMIVPAAGALLTIIEGLRAAWGTVSRILAAIALFIAFLKAVKTGNAAGPFAAALAAAGIVLIDFVANWLLQRLRKPAGAISGKLKAFAQKIAATLKKGFAAVKKGAKVAAGAIRKGAAAVGRAVKRGVKAVGGGLKKAGKAIGKSKVFKAITKSKIGRAILKAGQSIKSAYGKGKKAYQDAKAKLKAKWEKWKEKRKKTTPQEKLDRATKALTPKVGALLTRGVNKLRLKLQLGLWRVFYGLNQLEVRGSGHNQEVHAAVNPDAVIGRGIVFDRDEVYRAVSELANARYARGKQAAADLGGQTGLGLSPGQDPTLLGASIRDRGKLPKYGTTVPIQIGMGESVKGAQKRGASNLFIHGLGTYPEITEKLTKQGLTGPALSAAVTETLRTGKGPMDVKRLIALQFGTETARSNMAGLTTPLTLIGMERGAIKIPEGFGAPGAERPFGGGLYPPSQVGYVKAQQRTTERMGGKKFRAGTKFEASEENIERTIQLIAAVTQEMYFNDVAHFKAKVAELLEFFDKMARHG